MINKKNVSIGAPKGTQVFWHGPGVGRTQGIRGHRAPGGDFQKTGVLIGSHNAGQTRQGIQPEYWQSTLLAPNTMIKTIRDTKCGTGQTRQGIRPEFWRDTLLAPITKIETKRDT